ncbi:helix-turn-helix domain-containing protein [Nocardia arthritidis]|uniref:Helix-turn-helix domain-containing protein n=1 Tax=Nocardia arthritidis TaxID=228602 RepID=A0A6G9YBN0_9NOCA|nr:helix-turn-helix domain-containing protein [Nocardia arthritidis]QIS10639.1 helix-turn-helix domain-containing protein [Nocardia arthritidis]
MISRNPLGVDQARDLVSLQKAATLIDVDPKTIRNWINDGRLQGYKLNGRMWRVNRAEVLALARPIKSSGGAA